MRNQIGRIIPAILICLSCFNAHAAMFQGNSSGTFDNAQGTTQLVVSGEGTNMLTTGAGSSSSDPSRLTYTGIPFDVDPTDFLVLGTLTVFNGSNNRVNGLSTAASNVDLNLSINFTAPGVFSEPFLLNIDIDNTLNSNPNPGDIISFDSNIAPHIFSIPNIGTYSFEFLGFGFHHMIKDSFVVPERREKSVKLIGRITPTPVPVPAAVWLLGSALIGLVGLRRKQ